MRNFLLLLGVVTIALFAGCEFNPQPDPPGANLGTADAASSGGHTEATDTGTGGAGASGSTGTGGKGGAGGTGGTGTGGTGGTGGANCDAGTPDSGAADGGC